ncbi:hypothetical protein Tco_0153669, partial [Tanacetum coccineum]
MQCPETHTQNHRFRSASATLLKEKSNNNLCVMGIVGPTTMLLMTIAFFSRDVKTNSLLEVHLNWTYYEKSYALTNAEVFFQLEDLEPDFIFRFLSIEMSQEFQNGEESPMLHFSLRDSVIGHKGKTGTSLRTHSRPTRLLTNLDVVGRRHTLKIGTDTKGGEGLPEYLSSGEGVEVCASGNRGVGRSYVPTKRSEY